jgi:ABC-type uncharacterized transport system involved in gliding motility auxiliary subunit
MKRRALLGGANMLASLLLLAALLAGVNWLSNRHHWRKDLTANRAFSLAPQTRKLVTNLDRDINVIAFYRSGDSAVEPVRDLCREVADLSPRVHFEVVDPDRNPGRASRYPSLEYGVTVVDGGERTERVDGSSEAALVNAMIQVTRHEKKTIGFLTGHGEHDPKSTAEHGYSALAARLESEGYAVESLQLADKTAVPPEVSVLVIAGPEKQLFPNEQAAVLAYLERGGSAFLMSDPTPRASLAALAKPYGIEIGEDLVVDVSGVGKLFGADEFLPMGLQYHPHPLAQGFELTTVYPEARSIRATSPAPDDVSATEIVFTTDASWAESEPMSKPIEMGPKDRRGPICVLAAASQSHPSLARPDSAGVSAKPPETRLVVAGDSDFCSNNFAGFGGDLDLAMNALSWLSAEEDLIAIRPREKDDRRISLSESQAAQVRTLVLVLMPLSVMGLGVVVWWRRR